MKKKIILPTDFSDNARNAYHYAFSLFGFENVEYILFNTYLLPYTRMGTLINLIEIIEEISKKGRKGQNILYCRTGKQEIQLLGGMDRDAGLELLGQFSCIGFFG